VAPSEQGDDQAQGQPLSADIFISYSRKDIAFARLIRASLQASGLDTWIDWDRIPVGERWWDEICQAIERTHIFMFIISGSSMGSPVCRDEINQALKNHKRIIPILVDHLAPEAVHKFVPELPELNWVIFEKDHLFQIAENQQAQSGPPEDRLVALPWPLGVPGPLDRRCGCAAQALTAEGTERFRTGQGSAPRCGRRWLLSDSE